MALAIPSKDIDYFQVPLIALRNRTRIFISQCLNGIKIIPSPSGLPRDWRGLAHLGKVPCPPSSSSDPTSEVLTSWSRSSPSLYHLMDAFAQLDRYDVLDDTAHFIENDANEYLKSLESGGNALYELPGLESDIITLTIDDIQSIESTGRPYIYDAFLLYADEDLNFALEIIDKLENEHEMKLCTKERLVGGLSSEYDAIMTLIRERCTRLIIIVSPFFLNSPANNFFVNFAQALGIDQRQRKIIPVIYSKFQLPPQICYYFVLDYTRSNKLWDFWNRLSHSIRTPQRNRQLALEGRELKLHPKALESGDYKNRTLEAASNTIDNINNNNITKQDIVTAIKNRNLEENFGGKKTNTSVDSLSNQLERHVKLLEDVSHPEEEPMVSNSRVFLLSKIFNKRMKKTCNKKKLKKEKKAIPAQL